MTNYCAGFNSCGYMPDNLPSVFESFEEAKRSTIWTIKTLFEEEANTEEEAETYCHAAEDVNLESKEFSYVVLGTCFFVAETDEGVDD